MLLHDTQTLICDTEKVYVFQAEDSNFALKAGLLTNEALCPLLSPHYTASGVVLIASAVLKQHVYNDIVISPLTTHFQVLTPTSADVTTSKCLPCFTVPKK